MAKGKGSAKTLDDAWDLYGEDYISTLDPEDDPSTDGFMDYVVSTLGFSLFEKNGQVYVLEPARRRRTIKGRFR